MFFQSSITPPLPKKTYTKPKLLRKGSITTLTLKAGGSSDAGMPGVFVP